MTRQCSRWRGPVCRRRSPLPGLFAIGPRRCRTGARRRPTCLLYTSRIYGDTLSIQAGALANGAGAGGGAVIASRGNMNLGVGALTNRDHALIYSGADLHIGRALDAQGAAIDRAASILNLSLIHI